MFSQRRRRAKRLNPEDEKTADSIKTLFQPETAYYPEKGKLDVFEKQIDFLEQIFNDLNSTDITDAEGIKIYHSRLQQVYGDYQHQLTELRFDILSQFKDLPEFKDWFKKFVNQKDERNKPDPFAKYRLYRLTKTELIDRMRMLMETLAKEITFTAYLMDIFYKSTSRLCDMEITKRSIFKNRDDKRPKKELIKTDLRQGMLVPELAEKYHTSRQYVRNINYELEKEQQKVPVAVTTS